MEPQRWRNLGLEVRRPTPANVALAGALYYLLHSQPLPELGAAGIALIAVDCIRIRRTQRVGAESTGNWAPPANRR
ncbi:hypothetical protein ACFYOF_20450 [Streptomyces sp. NPDC007148]|uniref:hypothetical protein n=1 Tax=Streptomyces sp. NPDC007148 TaxID=3364775 RepID=UPI0036ACFF64